MIARVKAGGVIYYYYSGKILSGDRRIDVPLGSSLPVALERYRSIASYADLQKWSVQPDKSFVSRLYGRLKANARSRGIHLALSKDDVIEMIEKSGNRCALTGIPFSILKDDRYRVRPWAPSIDRIDSAHGYTKENCRVVCAYVNSALNEYGEELLLLIAKGLIKTAKSKLRTGSHSL